MDILSGEISEMVFKRVMRNDLEQISLDSQMLSVLMEIDGESSLIKICQKISINLSTMREVIDKLLKLKLIAPVNKAVPMLGENFFDALDEQLSLAIGPIAGVLIEDAVMDLGYNFSQVPQYRAAELVGLLDREIPSEEKKLVFKQNMLRLINKNGF